ncbi:lipid-A-disaccharide synthase [Luteolibacter sp. GHJ8]|uniref:Lipid-A-disaccharide synthase n=1 Tax=Luteolibacter rhizosphaerae TaxID=2989719 RepID=A0ABT3FWZ1_9BACT|nr:lipid-A-disaccharide synthase [Luteolibacter rhizosphaerae]MCW1912112.1 lipid-A-disaccharide synthase [Luteolibacter rhizosphaerae]
MAVALYVIAGELSGDAHGAGMLRALRSMHPNLEIHGAGGPEMRAVAGPGLKDWVEDAAVMGLWEVLKRYGWFKQRFAEMLAEVKALKPKILVLIDYPGFNLRFAAAVKEALPETKIIYYISPQVWAWNKGRLPKMAQLLDEMLCLFPFEKPIFEGAGLPTTFVGHPLVDELEEEREGGGRESDLVALLPGSREREVARLFPMMLEAARRLHLKRPETRFEACGASAKLTARMRELVENAKMQDQVTVREGGAHELMQRAECGVVASGTATLEAAYFGLPYCLVYKVAWPTYLAAKALVKIEHIGLINILAGHKVVEEFIQSEADPLHVEQALGRFLDDIPHREETRQKLLATASKLGGPGAHLRAASAISRWVRKVGSEGK